MAASDFPLRLSIDYPEEPNRLTSFFRIIVSIPISVVMASIGANILLFPALLMILFRRKYPRWWFDFNLEMMRFSARIGAYGFLLTHQYPSTDEEQSVHLNFEYPDVPNDLNRWLPLVKWFLAIPHFVVLFILSFIAVIAVIITWFAILFTGRVPRGLFNYMEGVMRYGARLEVYALVLTTDAYPPFSIKE